MDDHVTLSFSVKNLVTVNLMIALGIGALVLGTHLYRKVANGAARREAA